MNTLLQKLVSEELFASMTYECVANVFEIHDLESDAKMIRVVSREELEHVKELMELADIFNVKISMEITDTRNISNKSFKKEINAVDFIHALENEAIASYDRAIAYVSARMPDHLPEKEKVLEMFNHIKEEEEEHDEKFGEMLEKCIKNDMDLSRQLVKTCASLSEFERNTSIAEYYSKKGH